MKKRSFSYYIICWLVFITLFNIVAFITPNKVLGISKFTTSFFVGYGSIMAAFIGQLASAFVTFRAENKTKLFYNLPLIRISYNGLVWTLFFALLFMFIPVIPYWVATIVCFSILAFTTVAGLKAKVAGDLVSEIDEKTKNDTSFIKNLISELDELMVETKDGEYKKTIKELYEIVRYSDPKSSSSTKELEIQIQDNMLKLKESINDEKIKNTFNIINELKRLINERNNKIKLNKKD